MAIQRISANPMPIRVTNSQPYKIVSAVPGNPLDLRNGIGVVEGLGSRF
jgi:hypothetical protein